MITLYKSYGFFSSFLNASAIVVGTMRFESTRFSFLISGSFPEAFVSAGMKHLLGEAAHPVREEEPDNPSNDPGTA